MTDATINALQGQLGLNPANNKANSKSLGQEDFLNILVTQLQHQDPFEPQNNGEFIAQMAQFGTVDGIGKLQESFSNLSQSLYSNQALQASALVGRTVEVPSVLANLDTQEGLHGSVHFDADMQDAEIQIKDELGKVVKTINIGNQNPGDYAFHWDGLDETGATMPAGHYYLHATGNYNGSRLSCITLTKANVNSVTLGNHGSQLSLNLSGLGDVDFKDIYRIT